MATHSSVLVWRIPWTEEPGGLHTVHGTTRSQTWLSNFPFCSLSCDQYWWVSFNTEIPGQHLQTWVRSVSRQAQLPESGHPLGAMWWKSSGWRPSHWAERRGPWWDRIQRRVKKQPGHSMSWPFFSKGPDGKFFRLYGPHSLLQLLNCASVAGNLPWTTEGMGGVLWP